tara:strand:- start:57 stop:197 length:141 start_codon:yes stop_codon:yes gene_type:complete
MAEPQDWECEIARKVLESLKESGRTDTSVYVSTEETVKACERKKES